MKSITIRNTENFTLEQVPVLDYTVFFEEVNVLLCDTTNHIINYFAFNQDDNLKFLCFIGNDKSKNIHVFSHVASSKSHLKSLSVHCQAFQVFEREIAENYGVFFEDHNWLKPIRYPESRFNKALTIENYPFYHIESVELHEVGVGPVHAGIIEPGYFRFLCNGEQVLHLEIQLGYQHRSAEKLMLQKKGLLPRSVIIESIAGDSAIAHSIAFSGLIESLSDSKLDENIERERIIALELERVAMHIADTSALCADVAYQLGQVTCEALRTLIINATQLWCGNRFGKGLIRPSGTNYPLNQDIANRIVKTLEEVQQRFETISERIFTLPSILDRFESIGELSRKQAELLGVVGLAARSSGLERDVRSSHPWGYYQSVEYKSLVLNAGDVYSRALLRSMEVKNSLDFIIQLLKKVNHYSFLKPNYHLNLKPNSCGLYLTEGWRGEICHTAITDNTGELIHYKIKDPSFQNWNALAICMRNQEISDFPICNKSFNLSYCGHDL